MKSNDLIKNYSKYLEQKKNEKQGSFVDAVRACEHHWRDRYLFHNCLLSQGVSVEQVAVAEGISKQAVSKYLKRDKRSQSDRVLAALKTRPMYGLEIANALNIDVGFIYPVLNRLEKKGAIKSFYSETIVPERNLGNSSLLETKQRIRADRRRDDWRAESSRTALPRNYSKIESTTKRRQERSRSHCL